MLKRTAHLLQAALLCQLAAGCAPHNEHQCPENVTVATVKCADRHIAHIHDVLSLYKQEIESEIAEKYQKMLPFDLDSGTILSKSKAGDVMIGHTEPHTTDGVFLIEVNACKPKLVRLGWGSYF
jgi:hypothetical protein